MRSDQIVKVVTAPSTGLRQFSKHKIIGSKDLMNSDTGGVKKESGFISGQSIMPKKGPIKLMKSGKLLGKNDETTDSIADQSDFFS